MVDSKLAPPQVMVSLLARPRVDARLDEAFDAPLMLVCAPAGYGKTVAVASWVRSRGLALRPDHVDALVEQTEGWAAALRLAALACQRRRQMLDLTPPG